MPLSSSGCSSLRSVAFGLLDHPFSLVCYCVAVFLRAVFHSVGLRACTSGVPVRRPRHGRPSRQLRLPCRLHAEPARFLRLGCAPVVSPPMPIAILVISRVLRA
ncbi:hypothetical protein EVAR_52395_1 [Eumeta japonica]|uniref:Uncharacterized protein n=1 Tax=Eumeta variegata TaxID=151549 RepID=A0A4C1ZF90_EUMVA|nr:hypothetical protein EVAR_52395_1 [Eumeta japonica]